MNDSLKIFSSFNMIVINAHYATDRSAFFVNKISKNKISYFIHEECLEVLKCRMSHSHGGILEYFDYWHYLS